VKDWIPIIRPDVGFDEVEESIREVLGTGILTSGPYVAAFEKSVADRVGVGHAVATTSATTALHLALAAVGLGPGDEVLLSDFTYPATANAVIQTSATPVFVDSEKADFSMDPEHAASLVTERTRVIMPVDPLGQPANHASLEVLAAGAGAHLIVDAACSLGASRGGRECGGHGDMGCISFHPRKVVTCGEGGMVTTDDSALAERLRLLKNHGAQRTTSGILEFVEPGFNYRLSEVPAILGLAQMQRLDQILADRQRTAGRYGEALGGIPGVRVPEAPPDTVWSYQSYVVVLDESLDRNDVIAKMAAEGIETTIGTYACHQHPAFSRWIPEIGGLPNSARFADHSLTLPLVPHMDPSEVERVVESLSILLGSL
jgi:dTDP-4-amino-4,6-dideoxygalactose transaminase